MLRNEIIRTGDKAVARIAHVGVWLATYGNADGSNCLPHTDTLVTLTGTSEETVGRALRVLRTLGLITGKRRPNDTTVYQLHMPIGGQVDWQPHLHLFTETRQKRAWAKRKQAEIAQHLDARNPSTDGLRNPSASGVPEPVRSGGTNPPVTDPKEPRNPSVDGYGTRPRTDSGTRPHRGGDSYLPTSGRYTPSSDPEMADHSPQPQAARESPPRRAIQPPLMTSVPTAALREPDTPDAPAGGLAEFLRARAAEHDRLGVRPPLPERERRPAS
ncbi:helix-turn-helix domain-containing protein [Streptacidiphilus rugosus]|uniref:helix-turn-helix domain-containing protein n=1 Tax=Streptacidiphilus rugosus TaxID=405783 RepID=UPI000565AF65